MDAGAIFFYVIAVFILATAILAVTTAKIFRSAIWLLSSLIGVAALYFWMQLEFIAAVQIIVYVGGIVVLIIFSIFLTQQTGSNMPAPKLKQKMFAVLAALFGIGFSFNLINNHAFPPASTKLFVLNVKDIGRQMLDPVEPGYILPFEVISMLLLAAMIGCIVIAMKSPAEDKETPGGISQRSKGEVIIKSNQNQTKLEEMP